MTEENTIVTYVDACLLMAAFRNGDPRNEDPRNKRAKDILNDKRRTFLASDGLRLEVMPKAIYNKCPREVEFYERFFARAQRLPTTEAIVQRACEIASRYDIAPMDAIHIAHAIEAGAKEFITTEKTTKPMFRVLDIPMLSIADE